MIMKQRRNFKCTVKYQLTEYFLVTTKAHYVQHTVSSDPVIFI